MSTARADKSRSPRKAGSTETCSAAAALGLSLEGKRALVTGGSKGIGLETAQLFIQLGAEVAICARDEKDLQAAKQSTSCPERCHVISADLSSESGVKSLIEKLPYEELDILVNNAGMNIRKKAEEYASEDFHKVFDCNFMSCFWLSRAALPHLRRASDKSQAHGGTGAAIVNISSVAAGSHIPSGLPYAASKAAMDQLTRNLSVEWARFGIRVNSVAPGPIKTPLVAAANQTYIGEFKSRIPMKRIGEVSEVAILAREMQMPCKAQNDPY